MTVTVTDLFCGAGGSSIGAENVPGVRLRMAANHWPKAIEVHQRGFPHAAHDCADISAVDFRRYPGSDILLASPECTNHSASKGVSRRRQDPSLFDTPDPGAERSRATMWDVHRYIEVHRPAAAIVENVVDARSWVYWPSWWQAFSDAGYTAKLLSINSMHAGAVPQSRDRIYVVATRDGITPDLELRPAAWCPACERQRETRQTFKRSDRSWGRYRQQYLWRCARCSAVVEPPALGATAAIDWTLPSTRIGDRAKPLVASTTRRIRLGLERYGVAVVAGAGQTWERPGSNYARAWPVTGPFPVQAATIQHGVAAPPPAWYVKNYGDGSDPSMVHPVSDPFGTVTGQDHHALLVPYYRTGHARPTTWPMGTIETRDRHALVEIEVDLDDCTFRMLEPHEVGAAMAFPSSYMVDGTKRDRVRLYGNAVTPPVMQLLVQRVVEALAS